ncbi:MAG TPA: DUF6457 domain-containing protein [Nocardioidaceae bacterium]|nr:DUF6457 domain-containing protein [Nocardioidaceae bacterium]
MTIQEWMDVLADEFGIDTEIDMTAVLDLARDAARGVNRPSAPVTTFMVGYAAGKRGGSSEDISDCIDSANALVTRVSSESSES